jgi:hypothetical protein
MATDTVPVKQYPEWVRGTARIDDNDIVLAANAVERYAINEAEHRETLLQDLAALSRPHSQRAIDFVERHGLLWHGPEAFGNGECREPLDHWDAVAKRLHVFLRLFGFLETAQVGRNAQAVRNYLLSQAPRGAIRTLILEDDQQCVEYASTPLLLK